MNPKGSPSPGRPGRRVREAPVARRIRRRERARSTARPPASRRPAWMRRRPRSRSASAAASPFTQATIASSRGSPGGSTAPPACIWPALLVTSTLCCGACASTNGRTIASSCAASPEQHEPGHRGRGAGAVTDRARVHQHRMDRRREARRARSGGSSSLSRWRNVDERVGVRARDPGRGRRGRSGLLRGRRDRRRAPPAVSRERGTPPVGAATAGRAVRRRGCLRHGLRLRGRIETRAAANPRQHPLVLRAGRRPGRASRVHGGAGDLAEQHARLRIAGVHEADDGVVIGGRVARQQQA